MNNVSSSEGWFQAPGFGCFNSSFTDNNLALLIYQNVETHYITLLMSEYTIHVINEFSNDSFSELRNNRERKKNQWSMPHI